MGVSHRLYPCTRSCASSPSSHLHLLTFLQRTPAVLQSPVKAVKKRKAPMFDTAEQTEDEEDAPPAKK